jgi:hypothetical protein
MISFLLFFELILSTTDLKYPKMPENISFFVNDVADLIDTNTGDGICATINNTCTLRAAVMEANHSTQGGTIIHIPSGTYSLTIPPTITSSGTPGLMNVNDLEDLGDLNITNTMTITGSDNSPTIIKSINLDRVISIGGTTAIKVKITDVTITDGISLCQPPGGGCDSRESGGGLYISNIFSDVTLLRTKIINNTGGSGGGIANFGNLVVDGCVISNNTGAIGGSGGGIYSGGILEIDDSVVQDNIASSGGGIYSQSANLNNFGSLVVKNTLISRNTGGIVTSTPGFIYQSTVDNNSIDGGIINFGFNPGTVLNITKTTISNNKATASIYIPQRGGGITQRGGIINIVNSTISGNQTNKSGGGIALEAGIINLYNVTTSNNSIKSLPPETGNGGGVFVFSGALSMQNSILAGNLSNNSTADDCSGNVNSLGYNLIGSSVGCIYSDPTTRTYLDALVGPLQDNGGPTFTHALLPHSPAIRSGSPNGCFDQNFEIITTDQRGYIRPRNAACDVGSFEVMQIFFPVIGN